MDNFNINNVNINKLANSQNLQKSEALRQNQNASANANGTFLQNLHIKTPWQQKVIGYPGLTNLTAPGYAQEKSAYIKELMNLPKDMKDILTMLQNASSTASAASIKNLSGLLSANIDLTALSQILQKNGKEAVSKLISVMAENAKQGIDNSAMKDVMKLINASISVSSDNQTQTVKNFMLLYLPWLPLQEGKDFDLEVEAESAASIDDAILTIFIATVNFGNIKILVVSNTPSSFEVSFKCVKTFPKKEFLERVNTDNKKNSIQSNIVFDEKEEKSEEKKNHQAKVTMTNLKEVTPYMLIFTNTLIRNTIQLDNEKNRDKT